MGDVVKDGWVSVSRREELKKGGYADLIAIRLVDGDHRLVMDIVIDPADYARAITGLQVPCKIITRE